MGRRETNKYDTAITVRVKRFENTFFILCDEYESVNCLAGRMLSILEQMDFRFKDQETPFTNEDVRFCERNRILDPTSSCHDQQVFNDTVIYCLLRKPVAPGAKEGEFEVLAEVSGQEFEYDYPQKKKEEPKKVEDE